MGIMGFLLHYRVGIMRRMNTCFHRWRFGERAPPGRAAPADPAFRCPRLSPIS
jgi:hypothetical protein